MSKKTIPEKYQIHELALTGEFWSGVLSRVTRPSARRLVSMLDMAAPLGIREGAHGVSFGGGEGDETTMDTLCRAKLSGHSDKIVALQVGDFFEFFLADAVAVVEATGINPMAGSMPRCGVPLGNLQSIASTLTDHGFSVAVVVQSDEAVGRGRKKRFIAQVLTPSNPVFTFGLRLEGGREAAFRDSPPVVGVSEVAKGLVVCEVFPELAISKVSFGQTVESLKMSIRKDGILPSSVYFHSSVSESVVGQVKREFVYDGVDQFLLTNTFKRASGGPPLDFVSEVERLVRLDLNLSADFQFDRRVGVGPSATRMRPLYYASASQMGIIPTRGIPDLVSFLLPPQARAGSVSFLRSLILYPPSTSVGRGLRTAAKLMSRTPGIPDFLVTSPSRYIKPITTFEVSGSMIADLLLLLLDFSSFLKDHWKISVPVFDLVKEMTGFEADQVAILETSEKLLNALSPLMLGESGERNVEEETHTKFDGGVPPKLFQAIESRFRGRISSDSSEEMRRLNEEVQFAAAAFNDSVFLYLVPAIEGSKAKLVFDDDNETVWIKGTPKNSSDLCHPKDRNGRVVTDRLSAPQVDEALGVYKQKCDEARKFVNDVLVEVSRSLYPHRSEIMLINQFATAVKTMVLHLSEAVKKGWSFDVVGAKETDIARKIKETSGPDQGALNDRLIKIKGMFPYWLDKMSSVKNDFEIGGMATLVGSNMSGKSTVCRQVASVMVLHACGFLALPCESLTEPQFESPDDADKPLVDSIWIRMGSSDDPVSGLSAFAVEAMDVRGMFEEGTERSLMLIDELGKGCATRSGAAFAGAVLEGMVRRKFNGIFSTHWHELWSIGVSMKDVRHFHMELSGGQPTHRIKDGRKTDSHALDVALSIGVPSDVIGRAREFEEAHDRTFEVSRKDPELEGLAASPSVGENLKELQLGGKSLDGEGGAPEAVVGGLSEKAKTPNRYSMSDAISLLRNIEDLAGHFSDPIKIGVRGLPSAADSGSSCLYLLRTKDGFFYVGETDDIMARVKTHRGTTGKIGADFVYFVVPQGKTFSRKLESSIIRELAAGGFPMLSTNDGKHRGVS